MSSNSSAVAEIGQPFGQNRPGPKIGGCVPFLEWGKLGSHLTQCRLGRSAYLRTMWHLDLSNRLATIHQRYKQTDTLADRQDRRRSSIIGRTVLQTVAQKLTYNNLSLSGFSQLQSGAKNPGH